jgi:hypothetical protein
MNWDDLDRLFGLYPWVMVIGFAALVAGIVILAFRLY